MGTSRLVLVALAMFAAGPAALVRSQCFTPDDTKVTADPNSRMSLYKGQQMFSLKMLQTVNKMRPTENIFFSPFSVYTALMLSYFVSANHTEASLKNFLNLPANQDKVNTMQAYRLEKYFQKMRQMNGSVSYQLINANKLFVGKDEPVRDCMELLFENEIEKLDFAKDPEAAVSHVNNWISQVTRNQIDQLLAPGSLSKATRLVLTNAAYFKGVWKSRFPPENTKNDLFYFDSSKYYYIKMMKQKATFNHLISEKLGAHILEMPYKGDDISIFFLLPPFADSHGVTTILDRLNLDAFQEMVTPDSMIPRPVEVTIPKFTIEHQLDDLVQVLETMGVGDLFKPSADLSSLTGQKGLSLDDAIHKAKIKLDEDGTTAAAATAFFNFRSSRPLEPTKFEANHPFIYVIFDKLSQTVLFMGVFNGPTEKLV